MASDLESLATPALVVHAARLERNLDEMAALCRAAGLDLRPHAKTHKCLELARRQLGRGASGLTVALVEEAERFVAAGVSDDVVVAYPVVSRGKAERLARLARPARVAVFADSVPGLAALAAAATADFPLEVLIEIDCGQGRCGVPAEGEALLALARETAARPALRLRGVATHGGQVYRAATPAEVATAAVDEARAVVEAARRLRAAGFAVAAVNAGSTPTARGLCQVGRGGGLTELRPGSYVFHDRTQVALGLVPAERAALAVLATCVSRPAPERGVLDCGAKALALDRIDAVPGHPGHGLVCGGDWRPLPGIVLARLSEEHAVAALDGPGRALAIGERVLVIPNHACPVVNLFDEMHLVDGGVVVETLAVDARGHRRDEFPGGG